MRDFIIAKELIKGDLFWVEVQGTEKPHIALVIDNTTKYQGLEGGVIIYHTISHTEPTPDSCPVQIPCNIIPKTWYRDHSCVNSNNNKPSYLWTNSSDYINPSVEVKYVGRLESYSPVMEEICKEIHKCKKIDQDRYNDICSCEKLKSVNICIPSCDCESESGNLTSAVGNHPPKPCPHC